MNASLFVLAIRVAGRCPAGCPLRLLQPELRAVPNDDAPGPRTAGRRVPIRTVDVGERPDLAARFGIAQVPCFVLVIGGQVRQQLEGMQDESTLRGLSAQIPRPTAPARVADSGSPPRPRRSLPVRLADDDSQGSKWNFHLPLPSFATRNQNQQNVQIDSPRPSAGAAGGSDATADLRNALADATPPNAAAATDDDRRATPRPAAP